MNLIKSSNLGNEREFLFAPYSVFTVLLRADYFLYTQYLFPSFTLLLLPFLMLSPLLCLASLQLMH